VDSQMQGIHENYGKCCFPENMTFWELIR
jgi:hypothetical protein